MTRRLISEQASFPTKQLDLGRVSVSLRLVVCGIFSID